nr:endonuclease/exonuclease/phosphatase family protein [uncultured Deefgea sp.]
MRAKLVGFMKWPVWGRYGRLMVVLSLIGAGLGSFATHDWRLELFSHFLPFYIGAILLGGIFLPRWRMGLLLLVTILLVQLWVALSADDTESKRYIGPFRAIAMNLLVSNTEYRATEDWLLAQQPDLVLLTEATPLWQSNLPVLQRAMPYGCAAWEDSPFGIAVLLKTKPLSCEVLYTEPKDQLFPYLRLERANHTVVYGLHPPPPLGEELAAARNRALLILAQRIAAEEVAVIVLGDMNITPYSPLYQAFRHDAGLREVGFAGKATWSPMKGLPVLPLDRALVRGLVGSLSLAPYLGSDHRAIVLDVE